MADVKVRIDLSPLTQFLDNFAKEVTKDFQKSIQALAISTRGHIKEKAQNGLHSFREQYLDNLGEAEQEDAYNWVITLGEKATWLEEGKEAWDMKGSPGQWGLLKNPSGHTRDGRAYKIIPMEHGKPPTEQSSGNKGFEQSMTALLKSELRKREIPTGRHNKLEIDQKTGSPRIGKIAGFDINSPYPSAKANTQIFARVNVYQKLNQKTGKAERHFTTFRTAVEGDEKWLHPTAPALKYFEEAAKFAEREWETKVLPALMEKWK